MKPSSHTFLGSSIALFLLLGGCSNTDIYKLELMPVPEIYSEPGLHLLPDDRLGQSSNIDGIFFATDRMPVAGNAREKFYKNKRGHVLRLGIGHVQLEEGQLGSEEAKKISQLKNRGKTYSLSVTDVREYGVLDSSRNEVFDSQELKALGSADRMFAEAINKKLVSSKTRDIYIYVHGYKIVFTNPLLVATEFWHYLGYDGAFIAYSWPATPNQLAYARDLETAAYSSRNFRLFLEYLSNQTNVNQIHIIAHSAGTRVVIDALGQLALSRSGKERARKYRIGHVLLIGSDFDRDIFSGYLEDGLMNIPRTLTLYMSDTDKALQMSRFIFTRQRLGQVFSNSNITPEVKNYLQRTPGMVVIDVTNAESADAKKGHDYFRRSPWVSTDVLMTLKYNLPPTDRGIIQRKNIPIWTFPTDYVDRLKHRLKNILKKT